MDYPAVGVKAYQFIEKCGVVGPEIENDPVLYPGLFLTGLATPVNLKPEFAA